MIGLFNNHILESANYLDYLKDIPNYLIDNLFEINESLDYELKLIIKLQDYLESYISRLQNQNYEKIKYYFEDYYCLSKILKYALTYNKSNFQEMIITKYREFYSNKMIFVYNLHAIDNKLCKEVIQIITIDRAHYNLHLDHSKYCLLSILYLISNKRENNETLLSCFENSYSKLLSTHGISKCISLTDIIIQKSDEFKINNIIQPCIDEYLLNEKFIHIEINIEFWKKQLNKTYSKETNKKVLIRMFNMFIIKLIEEENILLQYGFDKKLNKFEIINSNFLPIKNNFIEFIKPKKIKKKEYFERITFIESVMLLGKLYNKRIYKEILIYNIIPKVKDVLTIKIIFKSTNLIKILHNILNSITQKKVTFEEMYLIKSLDIGLFIVTLFKAFLFEKPKYHNWYGHSANILTQSETELFFNKNYQQLETNYNYVLSRLKRQTKFNEFDNIIIYLNNNDFKSINSYNKEITLTTNLFNIEINSKLKQIENLITKKTLFTSQLFEKVFFMMFAQHKAIINYDSLFNDVNNKTHLLKYLENNPEFKKKTESKGDMVNNETEGRQSPNIRLSLEDLISLIDKAYEYCLAIKTKHFSYYSNLTSPQTKLLEGNQ